MNEDVGILWETWLASTFSCDSVMQGWEPWSKFNFDLFPPNCPRKERRRKEEGKKRGTEGIRKEGMGKQGRRKEEKREKQGMKRKRKL